LAKIFQNALLSKRECRSGATLPQKGLSCKSRNSLHSSKKAAVDIPLHCQAQLSAELFTHFD
jgi:hypothetical protein